MHIPIVEIPGCQPGYRNDNHPDSNEPDPRETVAIHLTSLSTCEAVSEFYSYIAYPDPTEATERKKYSIALARWAVLQRGEIDKGWNESTDMWPSIRPIVFSQPEQLYLKTYRRGSMIWWRRAQCAFMMLLPHLVEDLLGGLSPTVANIALVATGSFGYSTGSQKTVELRIWGPTKPVAHAAAAVMLCLGALPDPDQEWDDEHPLCYKQPFLATLFYEDVFRDFLLMPTELLRIQVPSCRRFQIREGDTIRFIAD